jgi:DNA-binding PadR family transcriptional regulator
VKLTTRMRDALTSAKHGPLRRVLKPGPGTPPWPAHPGTLHALERHELVTRGELRNRDGWPVTTWTITDTGRQALEPIEIFRHDHPVYLAPVGNGRSDYTTDPRNRVDDAEVTDPDSLESAWRQQAEQRRADAEDRRKAAQRLRRNLTAA